MSTKETHTNKIVQIYRNDRKLVQFRDSTVLTLDGAYVMAHQREAPTDITERMIWFIWFILLGLEPATIGSVT